MKRLAIIAIFCFLAFAEWAQGQQAKEVRAVFVHQESTRGFADAFAWQEILGDYQIACSLVSKTEFDREQLLDAQVIIVGAHSAERAEDKEIWWFNYWGDSQLVDVMVESGLPIIGLSMGGLSLFGQMDLPVGGGHYMHGSERFFTLAEYASEYLESPFEIEEADAVEISSHDQANDGYYHPPSYIDSILRNQTNSAYYSVVRYERFVLWGAGPDPGYLTESGRRLFANIAHKLAGSTR